MFPVVGASLRAGFALSLLVTVAQAGEEAPPLACGPALVRAVEGFFAQLPTPTDEVYRLTAASAVSSDDTPQNTLSFAAADSLHRALRQSLPAAILVDEDALGALGLLELIAQFRQVVPFFVVPRAAPISLRTVARARAMGFDEVLPTGKVAETYLAAGIDNFRDRLAAQRMGASMFAEKGIAGVSGSMLTAFQRVRDAGKSNASVLLLGATGTGKEQLARVIHELSVRAKNPLRYVNCSELRGETAASELFGHEKGSFTGAGKNHEGLFRATNGGTLVLDEVQTLPLDVQDKLLRVLEVGTVRPHGSTETYAVDVRIIAIANVPLKNLVAEGKFREDLYYRLAGLVIELDPLYLRKEDVRIQAEHFLRMHQNGDRRLTGFGPGVVELFEGLRWPGNSRQLSSLVREAVLTKRDDGKTVELRDLPQWLFVAYTEQFEQRTPASMGRDGTMHIPYGGTFDEMADQLRRLSFLRAMEDAAGNQSVAAETLGVARTTLRKSLREFEKKPQPPE